MRETVQRLDGSGIEGEGWQVVRDGDECDVTIWNDNVIQVDPPKFVNLTVEKKQTVKTQETYKEILANTSIYKI